MNKQIGFKYNCINAIGTLIIFFACTIYTTQSHAQILDTALLNNALLNNAIRIVSADTLDGTKFGEYEYNRLTGNVVIEHKQNTLTCDSAHFYQARNYVEAFGNAHVITNNGADIKADNMLYQGNSNKVILTHNVVIVDKENSLQADKCDYNLKTKFATYNNGGTLQTDNTTVSSASGTYDGISKTAYFEKDVVVTNPKYEVYSEALKYNTKTKIVTFIKKSTIQTDSTTITGASGSYNTINESGQFTSRTLVQNSDNDIEANELNYNKQTGITTANGNVVINDYANETVIKANKVSNNTKTQISTAIGNVQITDLKNENQIFANKVENNKALGTSIANGNVQINDFKEHRLLLAQNVFNNSKHKYTIATGKVYMHDTTNNNIIKCNSATTNQFLDITLLSGRPLISNFNEKDSLYIKADSFLLAPSNIADTLKKWIVPTSALGDSIEQNTDSSKTTKKTMLAVGKVRLFTDSLQAVCDSLSYSEKDSIYKLYKSPILWARTTQAFGDTIYAFTENNKVNKINIFNNASIISYTGEDNYYNQVKGINIFANIKDDALQDMDVVKNAESIYFRKDDNNAYEGMIKASSTTMRVLMNDKDISKIILYTEPEGVYYPMNKLNPSQIFLENYKWHKDKRPKNKFDLD